MKVPCYLAPYGVELSHAAHSLARNNENNFGTNSRQAPSLDFCAQSVLFSPSTSSYAENKHWWVLAERTVTSEYLLLQLNSLQSQNICCRAERSLTPENPPFLSKIARSFKQMFSGVHQHPPLLPSWLSISDVAVASLSLTTRRICCPGWLVTHFYSWLVFLGRWLPSMCHSSPMVSKYCHSIEPNYRSGSHNFRLPTHITLLSYAQWWHSIARWLFSDRGMGDRGSEKGAVSLHSKPQAGSWLQNPPWLRHWLTHYSYFFLVFSLRSSYYCWVFDILHRPT